MYKLDVSKEYDDPDYKVKSEFDPICNLSELKAHQVRRMPVFKDNLPSRVDVVGYVDPNKRIKQMVEAGIRIDAWNHALYDYENPDEEDDGFTMAAERDDWDQLDMLTEGAREKELYYRTMYDMYTKSLKAQSGAADSGAADSGAANGVSSGSRQNGETVVSAGSALAKDASPASSGDAK